MLHFLYRSDWFTCGYVPSSSRLRLRCFPVLCREADWHPHQPFRAALYYHIALRRGRSGYGKHFHEPVAGYIFFENLDENRGILESRIRPKDNSTNLIYRFADIILFPHSLFA